jgi:hypothetical protein
MHQNKLLKKDKFMEAYSKLVEAGKFRFFPAPFDSVVTTIKYNIG